MRKIQSFLLIPLRKSPSLFRFAALSNKPFEIREKLICLEFNSKNSFAKISKKKAEKIEKEKEKASSEIPEEIDLTPFENNLKEEVENYKKEIAKLRSGKLTPDLFDTFLVKAYGEMTPMSQLAQIVPRNATSINLSVYDESVIPEMMKFLENSDMNFQLKKQEKVITCSITSGNTRDIKEAALKTAKTLLESYKGKFRKIRMTGMESLKPYKKFISEDVMKEAENELQKIFLKQSGELEKALKDKEKELFK